MNELPSEEELINIHDRSRYAPRRCAFQRSCTRLHIQSSLIASEIRSAIVRNGCATSIVAVIKQSRDVNASKEGKKKKEKRKKRKSRGRSWSHNPCRDARKRAQPSTRDHPPEFIALEPSAIRFRSISNNLSRVLLFALTFFTSEDFMSNTFSEIFCFSYCALIVYVSLREFRHCADLILLVRREVSTLSSTLCLVTQC